MATTSGMKTSDKKAFVDLIDRLTSNRREWLSKLKTTGILLKLLKAFDEKKELSDLQMEAARGVMDLEHVVSMISGPKGAGKTLVLHTVMDVMQGYGLKGLYIAKDLKQVQTALVQYKQAGNTGTIVILSGSSDDKKSLEDSLKHADHVFSTPDVDHHVLRGLFQPDGILIDDASFISQTQGLVPIRAHQKTLKFVLVAGEDNDGEKKQTKKQNEGSVATTSEWSILETFQHLDDITADVRTTPKGLRSKIWAGALPSMLNLFSWYQMRRIIHATLAHPRSSIFQYTSIPTT